MHVTVRLHVCDMHVKIMYVKGHMHSTWMVQLCFRGYTCYLLNPTMITDTCCLHYKYKVKALYQRLMGQAWVRTRLASDEWCMIKSRQKDCLYLQKNQRKRRNKSTVAQKIIHFIDTQNNACTEILRNVVKILKSHRNTVEHYCMGITAPYTFISRRPLCSP